MRQRASRGGNTYVYDRTRDTRGSLVSRGRSLRVTRAPVDLPSSKRRDLEHEFFGAPTRLIGTASRIKSRRRRCCLVFLENRFSQKQTIFPVLFATG